MPIKPSRRKFIQASAATSVGLAVGIGCNEQVEEPLRSFDEIPQGTVALVRSDSAEEAVRQGLRHYGSLSFIQPGQTVMLKPNYTGPLSPPDTTSPAVLVTLIEELLEAGAGEVIVAERTVGGLTTASVFDVPIYENGSRSMLDYVQGAGASFRPLDDEPWDEVLPDGADDWPEPFLIPRLLSEVDHWINVPALKTHDIAVFTMTMKNLFGVVHPDSRNNLVHGHPLNDTDPERQLRMFAQMNLAFHPILNVMDAMVCRTTGGPTPPGDEADMNLIMFGKDRVAMDAVGLELLKLYGTEAWIEDKPVWEQVQLAEALRVGVGITDPSELILEGYGVEETQVIGDRLFAGI